MELIDVVKKLIGPVEPVGDSNVDDKRLENLKQLTSLTVDLVDLIRDVSLYKNNYQHSMKIAGEHANECLKDISNYAIEN